MNKKFLNNYNQTLLRYFFFETLNVTTKFSEIFYNIFNKNIENNNEGEYIVIGVILIQCLIKLMFYLNELKLYLI